MRTTTHRMHARTHWIPWREGDHAINEPVSPQLSGGERWRHSAVVLVLVGAALMVAEAHVPTHGVLGAGAVVALTAGVVLALSASGAAGVTVIAAGITVALAGMALAWLLFVKSLGDAPPDGAQRSAAHWRVGSRRSVPCRRRSARCNSTARSGAPECGISTKRARRWPKAAPSSSSRSMASPLLSDRPRNGRCTDMTAALIAWGPVGAGAVARGRVGARVARVRAGRGVPFRPARRPEGPGDRAAGADRRPHGAGDPAHDHAHDSNRRT